VERVDKMEIIDVKAFPLSFPLEEAAHDATGKWKEWNTVIVKVYADDGTIGIGEVGPIHGGGMEVFKAIIEGKLKKMVIGENPFDREKLFEKMLGHGTSAYAFGTKGAIVSAVASIDIALWDLVGKVLKVPIYDLLGGKCREKIPAYASGFFGKAGKPLTPEECAREALLYVDEGFTAMKMKVGFDSKSDLKRVKAVRDAIGPDIDLMVDANQSYSFPLAVKMARLFGKYDITWLEEPIPINDIEAMAALTSIVEIPIAAGENYYTRYEFRDLLVKRAVDIIQPDIIHAGGVTECKRIASMANAWNIPCAPHIHSTVGMVASIHLLASIPNGLVAEYITRGGSSALRDELFTRPLRIKNGYIEVPKGPGLGIELNEETLKKYSSLRGGME